MVNERDIIIGNLTTILMFVFSAIGGGAIIDMLGGTSQASIIIGACLGVGYAIINAYFPNHLGWLNNKITENCNCEMGIEDKFEEELKELEEDENLEDEKTC